MNVVAIVFIAGAHCVSPLDGATNATTAYKVPCAIVYTADNPPPKAAPVEVKPSPVVKKKKPCKRRYYWKKKKRYWKCR